MGCNTTTGALSGAGAAALIGAVADRGNPAVGALIGAGVGAVVGGVIGKINEDQKKKLQQNSPQTWQTIQYSDQVATALPPPANPSESCPRPP